MVKNTVHWLCSFASLRFNHSLPQVFDAQDYGTGVGGKNLNRQGREVRQGGIGFLNSPYGEGSCSPFAEDLQIGSLGLCKGAGSTLLQYRLGDLAVQSELRGFIPDSEEGTTKGTKDTKGRLGLLGNSFSSFQFRVFGVFRGSNSNEFLPIVPACPSPDALTGPVPDQSCHPRQTRR